MGASTGACGGASCDSEAEGASLKDCDVERSGAWTEGGLDDERIDGLPGELAFEPIGSSESDRMDGVLGLEGLARNDELLR